MPRGAVLTPRGAVLTLPGALEPDVFALPSRWRYPNAAPGESRDCTIGGLNDYGIVFDSDAGKLERRVYSMRADGASLQVLTAEGKLAQEPALSPDLTRLAYATPDGVEVLALATQETERREPYARRPMWTSDGSFFSFVSYGAFVIGPPVVENGYGVTGTAFAFSPEGTTLVYSDGNDETGRYGIAEVEMATGSGQSIVPSSSTRVTQPSPSPDGTWVVASMWCGTEQTSSLWVTPRALATAACEGRPITGPNSYNASNPSWGPGTLIAYERGNIPRQIAIVDANTGEECWIEHRGDARNPRWFTLPSAPPPR
jgi:Tol biopolymer transport system component